MLYLTKAASNREISQEGYIMPYTRCVNNSSSFSVQHGQQKIFQSISSITKSICFVLSVSCFGASFADASTKHHALYKQSRYVLGVVSILQDHHYIRTHDAPIYWKISPYYLPQPTDASCSLASATMVMNALRIPQIRYANQKLVTTNSVLHSSQNAWKNDVKQGGNGVTLDEFGSFLSQAMNVYNILPTHLAIIHATHVNDFGTKFHQALLEGEKTGRTFIIVNFDQKFISGTERVGHFAPVGAYDANTKRVLIMDPDREFFEPYWVPEHQLLRAMETADSDAHKNRGFVIVTLK